MKTGFFVIALAFAVAACNNSDEQNNASGNPATDQAPGAPVSTSNLYGKEWKLQELNGKAVVLDTTFPRQPYLSFGKDNRISGNLGCNNFRGNLELLPDNKIKLSEIAATQMACPNLEVEQAFLETLQNAKTFVEEGNTLTLSNDKNEVTAKLQAQ